MSHAPGIVLASAVLLVASGVVRADEAEIAKLRERAAAVRPTAAESRWMQIPWARSVIDGQRMAREERRPIMYWHVDDDPLERC